MDWELPMLAVVRLSGAGRLDLYLGQGGDSHWSQRVWCKPDSGFIAERNLIMSGLPAVGF